MRVGERIEEVCEILEKHGPMGCGDIIKLMAPTDTGKTSNAFSYCNRALKKGLVTVEVSPIGNRSHYSIFTVRSDWRERIKPTPKAPAKPYERVRAKGVFSYASSIFSVGV